MDPAHFKKEEAHKGIEGELWRVYVGVGKGMYEVKELRVYLS
ncbi:MAG: hypothetical protein V4615_15670 [Bacteroidota bacterium]